MIDLILEQPALPQFITGKLASWLIGYEPNATLVASLAEDFRRRRLRDPAGSSAPSSTAPSSSRTAPTARTPRRRWEFVVGAARALQAAAPPQLLLGIANRMGQMILNPPSPAGWPSGDAWVNGNTALLRSNFAMAAASTPPGERRGEMVGFDPRPLLEAGGATDAPSVLQTFTDLLYDGEVDPLDEQILLHYLGDLTGDSPDAEAKVRSLVYLILSSPVYALS